MLLRLRTGNQKSRYVSTDTISGDAHRDLKRWGRWVRARIYASAEPQCILGGMAEYGAWVRSGYTEGYSTPDPRIEQTSRVLVFIPEELFSVLYMQYALDCDKRFKFKRLGLTQQLFKERLDKAMRFYDRYKDTDFL